MVNLHSYAKTVAAAMKASQDKSREGNAKGRPNTRQELFQVSSMGTDLAGTEAAGALGDLLLADGDNVDLEVVEAHVLEQGLGVGVDVELAGLGLGDIQSRDLGDVLVLALTLLLLELEGDTADGATLDTLHQVGGVTSDLNNVDNQYSRPVKIL